MIFLALAAIGFGLAYRAIRRGHVNWLFGRHVRSEKPVDFWTVLSINLVLASVFLIIGLVEIL